jgi:ABC-2 type transport system permease protein
MTGTRATTIRVLRQLRHDPRTVVLLLVVPTALMTIFRFVYDRQRLAFEVAGPALMVIFPLFTMFLVSSVAVLRERTTGTLERLMTTPLGRLPLLAGYGIAFTLLAIIQAGVISAVSLGPLGLTLAGSTAFVVVLAAAVALLGLGLGLLASAFARTEFQVVQFFPAMIVPQLLLCGLLVRRDHMSPVLHAISDVLPMSYAVDAIHHLAHEPGVPAAALGDLAIVVAFAVSAIVLGALTLRRRTD